MTAASIHDVWLNKEGLTDWGEEDSLAMRWRWRKEEDHQKIPVEKKSCCPGEQWMNIEQVSRLKVEKNLALQARDVSLHQFSSQTEDRLKNTHPVNDAVCISSYNT